MLKFTLDCTPTAQARVRHAVRYGHSVAYKSGNQQANERTLEALLAYHKPKLPLAGPVVLEFVAAMPIPASASKKRKDAMLRGAESPTKKPDLDNLAKQLKDAMTRLQFWGDDKQVVSLRCEKVYAELGAWSVAVYPAVKRNEGLLS